MIIADAVAVVLDMPINEINIAVDFYAALDRYLLFGNREDDIAVLDNGISTLTRARVLIRVRREIYDTICQIAAFRRHVDLLADYGWNVRRCFSSGDFFPRHPPTNVRLRLVGELNPRETLFIIYFFDNAGASPVSVSAILLSDTAL